MTKPPPVPQDNRSPKGPGADPASGQAAKDDAKRVAEPKNSHQQGQTANTEQNTTHQGDRQNRG
jgi:hypothetical protein